jgi:IS5 family transposase
MEPGLIEKVAVKTHTQFFMLDAGYDHMKVYEAARNVKAHAISPSTPEEKKNRLPE